MRQTLKNKITLALIISLRLFLYLNMPITLKKPFSILKRKLLNIQIKRFAIEMNNPVSRIMMLSIFIPVS
ncbi:MAG: hypothetical protein C0591_06415 [Marinilabiliales bacterium]|nr:MAG: hypothetical protein C0591_06415 [Marinilabiliales bacterium]